MAAAVRVAGTGSLSVGIKTQLGAPNNSRHSDRWVLWSKRSCLIILNVADLSFYLVFLFYTLGASARLVFFGTELGSVF